MTHDLDYNVRDFGAVGDGQSLCTGAIQSAIDRCIADGGGRVVLPAGAWVTGSLALGSNVELHLSAGCRLIASTSLEHYVDLVASGFHGEHAPERSSNSLIRAVEASNVAITGTGEIDGSGLAFYEPAPPGQKRPKPPTPRPRLLMLYRCRDVRLEGVSLVDSANWTVWLMRCQDVSVRQVRIRGNRLMRNNDGIDVDACRNVIISDCIFDTEDDCIAVRAIQRVYDEPAVCENVVVSNCVMSTGCQGVRVGCPSDGVIRNCSFTNLVINSTGNGILLEYPHRYASGEFAADVHDIHFASATIKSRLAAIKVVVEDGIRLQGLSDLSFSDIRLQAGQPVTICGSDQTTVRNVRLSGLRVATSGGDAVILRRCQGVSMADVEFSNAPYEG